MTAPTQAPVTLLAELMEALEYAAEHMEERLGHLLGGDDEKCIKHCRDIFARAKATEGEG